MDEDGYEYWAGASPVACYSHRLELVGENSPGDLRVDQLQAVSEDDMSTLEMQMDDGRILTFRESLDELIELDVEFPRFFCGSES